MNEYTVTLNEVAVLRNEYFVLAETKEEALALAAKEIDRGVPELVDIQYREPVPEDRIGIAYAEVRQVGFLTDEEYAEEQERLKNLEKLMGDNK